VDPTELWGSHVRDMIHIQMHKIASRAEGDYNIKILISLDSTLFTRQEKNFNW